MLKIMLPPRGEEELEVVWSGGMELLPPRDQRPDPTWTPPKRLYNRKRKKEAKEAKGLTGSERSREEGNEDGNDTDI